MTPIFWAAVALDTVLFVALLALGFAQKGISDGGREMGLFFSVIIPAVVVGVGVLLFLKSESKGWRTAGLIIVAGPGLLLGATRLRSEAIDYQVRRNADGSGYFSGREMKRAGSAVVRRDTAALAALDSSSTSTRRERAAWCWRTDRQGTTLADVVESRVE